jgi:hypothetical protein
VSTVIALPPTVRVAVFIVMAEALLGVDVPLPLAPYRPLLPLPVVEEPHTTMRSARARLTAKKRIVLECFICWILLCCFPGSRRGYEDDEVGHQGALEECNPEMSFCCQVSPHIYTQRVTPATSGLLSQTSTPLAAA